MSFETENWVLRLEIAFIVIFQNALYLSYQAPHSPKTTPQKLPFRGQTTNTSDILRLLLKPGFTIDRNHTGTDKILSEDRIKHAQMVIALDLALERVIATLKDEDMWKNTGDFTKTTA